MLREDWLKHKKMFRPNNCIRVIDGDKYRTVIPCMYYYSMEKCKDCYKGDKFK